MKRKPFLAALCAMFAIAGAANLAFAADDLKITVEHISGSDATKEFKFKTVPAPAKNDAATGAKFSLISGYQDGNGGSLDKLHDGALPSGEDTPEDNFFFNAGGDGGRFTVDLKSAIDIFQVNSYSWHPGSRAPQVYKLYASDGTADGFKANPGGSADPASAGWKLIATVDTRPKDGEAGGQYGVSIAAPDGPLGHYRYLLFDCKATEKDDDFGNTFYSEIDVAAKVSTATASSSEPAMAASGIFVTHAPDGSCEITIDTTKATDMTDWAEHKLAPVLAEWYPKITAMLPTPGYTAPKKFTVTLAPGNGVAATGGTRVTGNATWFRGELDKQGIGALLHEEVHVVQQYGGGRRNAVPGNFSLADITNLVSLAKKLKDKSDPISIYVNDQLTPAERKALKKYKGPGPKAYMLRTNLVTALNRIVNGPAIYGTGVFANVTLRDTTTSLRDEKPGEGRDLARLNRSLLEDAYPGELAHGGGGRNRGNTGWLTEGIPDYIRWFIYEPKAHGADLVWVQGESDRATRRGRPYEPKYDGAYRISANFLNFVTQKYDKHLVTKLNDALRQGKYYDDIWVDDTGKSVQQLNEEWLAMLHKEIKTNPAPTPAKT